jgi:hypothetical protein
VRPTHGRRDFTINKEPKLNYAFADTDEGFPRISARSDRGQQHSGNDESIFVHWSISCGPGLMRRGEYAVFLL